MLIDKPRCPGRLALPDVTLVAVTGVALLPTIAAMQRCIDQVEFGAVLLLSDREPPAGLASEIEWRQIVPLRSRQDYSEFMLKQLHGHVATTHLLCVQWDGFILDAARWSPDFLDYDYIGAPWPHFKDGYRVGNGGFSLRSRRLLQASSELDYDGAEAEDTWICRTARPQLEAEFGIRFASAVEAGLFAFERSAATGDEFGFHGVFNMGPVVGGNRLAALIKQLEPTLIARNELWDLIRWAIKNGQVKLVWQLAKRLRRSV